MRKRNKHNLSNYRLLTCNMGQLIPIGLQEALPGDTFQLATSAMIRVSPLAAPVMHPVSVRIHHFFVPHRLVWNRWDDFITGGSDGAGDGAGSPPTYNVGASVGDSLNDYLGIAPALVSGQYAVNLMPVAGVNLIWNEYYRDQDLQAERVNTDGTIPKIGWGKDYFTTARPWTQKGPAVTIPFTGNAIVKPNSAQQVSGVQTPVRWRDAATGAVAAAGNIGVSATSGNTQHQAGAAPGGANLYIDNLYADLTTASATNVIEFRRAFALQRYQEARARYGSRYTEYLRYLGVTPSDARLQRPEYIGGGSGSLNFSEVLQTAMPAAGATRTFGVGDLYGHGVAGVRTRRARKFIEEHGYIHSFLSVRPKGIYMNGTDRHFFKKTKEDFWQKELEHIGQQPILQNELVANGTDPNSTVVFGYQDRYREYRETRSQVQGEFRTTLNYWHMGRDLSAGATLNGAFVGCDPTTRIHNVTTGHKLWVMVNNHVVARRLVARSAGSKIL